MHTTEACTLLEHVAQLSGISQKGKRRRSVAVVAQHRCPKLKCPDGVRATHHPTYCISGACEKVLDDSSTVGASQAQGLCAKHLAPRSR